MFVLHVPSHIICDGETVEFKIIYNLKLNKYAETVFQMTVFQMEINTPRYGISEYTAFNQCFINGIMSICETIHFCIGLKLELNQNHTSNVLVHKNWSTLAPKSGQIRETSRYFAHNCHLILPYMGEYMSNTCTACVHDLR